MKNKLNKKEKFIAYLVGCLFSFLAMIIVFSCSVHALEDPNLKDLLIETKKAKPAIKKSDRNK